MARNLSILQAYVRSACSQDVWAQLSSCSIKLLADIPLLSVIDILVVSFTKNTHLGLALLAMALFYQLIAASSNMRDSQLADPIFIPRGSIFQHASSADGYSYNSYINYLDHG
jgi:hypothetical protein